jgi:hypothetical protein
MDISYYDDENFINAELFRVSDGQVFQEIADELTNAFDVQWKAKIDGLDQRYWDFEYKGYILTLHLEHYLGISIFIKKSTRDINNLKQVLEEIGDHFKTWNPPN